MIGKLTQTTQNGYEFFELIGKGGFSEIYKVKSIKFNIFFAAKVINFNLTKNLNIFSTFLSEYNNLIKLDHKNIIRIYDKFEKEENLFLILELCCGINLFEDIQINGIFNEKKFLIISKQICEAINYSHEQGIAHLDIKPQNILFDNYGRPKISDFGLSIDSNIKYNKPNQGTIAFLSPEILLEKDNINIFESDIWSLGITFYFMLIGNIPFIFNSITQYKKKIISAKFYFPNIILPSIKNLIISMLNIDPLLRPNIKNILESLTTIQNLYGYNTFSLSNNIILEKKDNYLTFQKNQKTNIEKNVNLILSFRSKTKILIPIKKKIVKL